MIHSVRATWKKVVERCDAVNYVTYYLLVTVFIFFFTDSLEKAYEYIQKRGNGQPIEKLDTSACGVIQIFENETPMFAKEDDVTEKSDDGTAYDLLFLHDGLIQNVKMPMPMAMIADEINKGERDRVEVKQEYE